MGVKNLWDILESCKQTLPLHHLQNKRVCVDLSCWMVQLQTACRGYVCVKEKVYLRNLFHRLRALIALNCSVIFVTDGSIPGIKVSTYRRRLGLITEVATHETNLQKVPPLRRNMGSEFSCMIKEAKVLGVALGIPCLDGIEEAEAQCALLNSSSLCDGCFSLDSDVFLFGARTVYRDICLGEGGYVICYEMADIESKLGFGRNSLITLGLLLGNDYSKKVHGFGPETACQVVRTIGDDNVLREVSSEGYAIVKKKISTKKLSQVSGCGANKENELVHNEINVNEENKISTNQFLHVINAYLKPKCHPPDSEAVQRVCAPHPFLRTELRQICAKYFDWSPEKTDEYILPKIAERDLRRFANLCSTSSEFGDNVALHKMPVTCPLSAIRKERKLQGREYFEVSWQGVDGLNTSIVPADLVECACPEKITEFMARKGEPKKRVRKPGGKKKSSGKAAMNEVDLQLQGLLISIQSQAKNFPRNVDADINVDSINAEVEVIDLLTPSPPIRACKVAKYKESIAPPVDVIDVCESESDESVEHEKKARELRLFLDSIRGDIYLD
ncbi:Flap endonuclease GEN-like 2 [Acorus gramineus]|uniref:Single-strand DNA endonuclease 1 n=1 Tax=Acorus gramineus TaxID=55184 RepID=A0AAV9ASC2_ACOGR|nr:Flap endonuclease GEN-like 2 [Acorus gramineus]